MSGKKLRKSNDKKVCGVCGGIAEYFDMDPTVVRIVYALLLVFTGIGILPYVLAAIIMDEPENDENSSTYAETNSYSANNVYESDEPVGFKPDSNDEEVRGFKI